MPICIECTYPVSQLYHVLQSRKKRASSSAGLTSVSAPGALRTGASSSKASHGGTGYRKGSSTGGGDVRLTQCPRCKRFADKYVEHDLVVLFIDLVLVKPQVYRHLLFNRFPHDAVSIEPSIRRLGILLLLFDVYLTMIHIESLPQDPNFESPIIQQNVLVQWAFFVVVCGLAALAQHATIRYLASFFGLCSQAHPTTNRGMPPSYMASPASVGPHDTTFSSGGTDHEPFHNSQTVSNASGNDSLASHTARGVRAQLDRLLTTSSSTTHLFRPLQPPASVAPSATVSGAATPRTEVNVAAPEPPRPPTPSAISTALFMSSCMSLFPILMIVWRPGDINPSALPSEDSNDSGSILSSKLLASSSASFALQHAQISDHTLSSPSSLAAGVTTTSSSFSLQSSTLANTDPSPSASSSLRSSASAFLPAFLTSPGKGVGWVRSGVAWAVTLQNLEALRILLGCGYLSATALVLAGGLAKWVVRAWIMGLVGLSEH